MHRSGCVVSGSYKEVLGGVKMFTGADRTATVLGIVGAVLFVFGVALVLATIELPDTLKLGPAIIAASLCVVLAAVYYTTWRVSPTERYRARHRKLSGPKPGARLD